MKSKINPYILLCFALVCLVLAAACFQCIYVAPAPAQWRLVNGLVAAPEYGEGKVYRCLMPCEIYVKETSNSTALSKLSVPRGNYVVDDAITFYKNNVGQATLFGNTSSNELDFIFYVFGAFFAISGLALLGFFTREMMLKKAPVSQVCFITPAAAQTKTT